MMPIKRYMTLLLAAGLACSSGTSDDGTTGDTAGDGLGGFDPPVLVNAEPPVRYPPPLFEQRTEGTVVLRLFVDADGNVVPDSTRVAEGSGFAEFDAAALEAVSEMHFAPARQDGTPIATAFLQPVHFRHPDAPDIGGGS
jgi:TonB family protein